MLCGVLAVACDEREAGLELSAFAQVQIDDRGATTVISAADNVGLDLLVEGWGVARSDETSQPILVMRQRKSRLLFFSPDGSIESVEGLFDRESADGKLRRLRYCLNGKPLGTLALFPGHPGFRLEFPADAIRRGRNVLDLSIENERGRARVAPLEVERFRFLPVTRSGGPVARAGRKNEGDGDLWLPVGSSFEAALYVPDAARLEGRLEANRFGYGDGPIKLSITLIDDRGARIQLLEEVLRSGASARVDRSLQEWAEQLAGLRIDVEGPINGVVRFGSARITGPSVRDSRPFSLLVRPQPVAPSKRLGMPDVVMVLLDAARADAFSPYGGPHPTPSVDRLASEGTRFARALSPSSWTGQSIPAVFTGLFPDALGISSWGDSLSDAIPTLAEAFSAAGYHTTLWSQHPFYRLRPGLTRGFDEIHVARRDMSEELPELSEIVASERPTFAFVHFLPPHAPYAAPAPFAGRLSSWYQGDIEPSPELLNQFPARREPQELTQADVRFIRDRYQEQALYADSLVGDVIEALEEAGLYNDALVALLSDHGEAFLEHDHFLHTNQIYTELVHVPLVVKWPSSVSDFRANVTATVTLVDLMPTLIDGIGLTAGVGGFQGRSLLPDVFDDRVSDRAIYAMTSGVHLPAEPPKRQLRLEFQGWSLIYDPQSDDAELYRLAEDPAETTNLAVQRPALALLLKQELLMQHLFNRSLLTSSAESAGEDLEPALAKELRALGYL